MINQHTNPEVKNAADAVQVKAAAEKELRGRERDMNDLRHVLNDVRGRRFVWKLLGHCRTFESIFEASAKIHYNSGRQDVGHYLLAEIGEANEEALFVMMRESQKENGKDFKVTKEVKK
jgi:hypothetical protein